LRPSDTTPAETLAAVREDAGGATLERIVHGMTGLSTEEQADGSKAYRSAVAACSIARERWGGAGAAGPAQPSDPPRPATACRAPRRRSEARPDGPG
jgi:hypothetical protein